MIRNGRALFISLTVHGLLALGAVALLQAVTQRASGEEEARMCIALSAYAPKPSESPQQPKAAVRKTAPPPPAVKEKPPVKPLVKTVSEPAERPVPDVPLPSEPAAPAEPEPVEPSEAQERVNEHAEDADAAPSEGEAVADLQVAEGNPESQSAAQETLPSEGERYLEAHLAQIAALLREHLYYPKIARKRGITGEVVVSFDLLEDGSAVRIAVVSGNHSLLNQAAVETIARLSGQFPRPNVPLQLEVPIRYELQ